MYKGKLLKRAIPLFLSLSVAVAGVPMPVLAAPAADTAVVAEADATETYKYVYAGLTWGEYWKSESVYNAGDTSSSDETDARGEYDKGAFDVVSRATANHGLHRGSYQCESTIYDTEGNAYDVSDWTDKNIANLIDGSSITFEKGTITDASGATHTMDHYEVKGIKYVPVKVKAEDYEDFCKAYHVVGNDGTVIGGYAEKSLSKYEKTAAVTEDTNGLKEAVKQEDGTFAFTARQTGSASGLKDEAQKTVDPEKVVMEVKEANGSYGEFLRVDFTGDGYGDLGASMYGTRWDYYGADSTYQNCLTSFGTKFAADNWMHSSMGIQLGLTDSLRCQLPEGTDGTGYWALTIYALGSADYTVKFQATKDNIVTPVEEEKDTTELAAAIAKAEALKEADYTAASWSNLQTELKEAKDELAEPHTQATIDEATAHLNAAIEALVQVKFTLKSTKATIYTGKTVTIQYTKKGLDDQKVTYKSSNTKVATVSSKGVVKGVAAGTAKITVKCGSKSATFTVTVKNPSVKLSKVSVTLYTKGSTKTTLKATLNGLSGKVTYKSSNTKVATVSSKGVVTAKKAGKATITATCGKYKATCKVTVKNPSVKLAKTSATIKVKKTVTIKATATPSGKITYKTSNKKVATVSSKGVVKGVKKGTATITVSCNGATAKFKVTVK